MDLHQIPGEGVRPLPVEGGGFLRSRQPLKILVIRVPFRPLSQQEEFFRRGDRDQLAVFGERPHVQRDNVSRQAAIAVIVPQHGLCPIGRMLMAERAGTHRP